MQRVACVAQEVTRRRIPLQLSSQAAGLEDARVVEGTREAVYEVVHPHVWSDDDLDVHSLVVLAIKEHLDMRLRDSHDHMGTVNETPDVREASDRLEGVVVLSPASLVMQGSSGATVSLTSIA